MGLLLATILVAGAVVVAAFAAPPRSESAGSPLAPVAKRPLVTAVFDPGALGGPDGAAGFGRVRAAGASLVRISVPWNNVAPPGPGGREAPKGFDQSDPADPRYSWGPVDTQVQEAVAAGLQPILDVWNAPIWVQHDYVRTGDGPYEPSTSSFEAFAHAIATRYSGSFDGLPRVRYWEVWNEPNVSLYLMPQYDKNDQPVSPGLYRGLLNSFAAGVKGVHSSNFVIAAALSPFTVRNNAVNTVGPLDFLRRLLCVSNDPVPRSTCQGSVAFDALSFHPYGSGAPTRHALNPNDLVIADIPKLAPILTAAQRLGHLSTKGPVPLWITEFGWNTNPPDPTSVPIQLQVRWVAEALRQAWQEGVTLFTWLMLRDQPLPQHFQSGLYFDGATFAQDRPKPTLTAFRFPFTADRTPGGAAIWGRSPASTAASVLVERRVAGRWQLVARLRANRYGIFGGTVPAQASDKEMRAVVGREASLAFALDPPPNENLQVSAFGDSSKKPKGP